MQHIEYIHPDYFAGYHFVRYPGKELSSFIDYYWETDFDSLWKEYPEGFSDVIFPNIGYTYLINLGTPFRIRLSGSSFLMKIDCFMPRNVPMECFHKTGNKIVGIKFKLSPVLLEKKINFSEYRNNMYPLSYLIDRDIFVRVKGARSFDRRVDILNYYYSTIVQQQQDHFLFVKMVSKILEECSSGNGFTQSIGSASPGNIGQWVGWRIVKKFADKNKMKHYCWILGQDARKTNKYPISLDLPANELIALSDFLQDEFKKNHGIKPAFIITPGVDSKQFDSKIKEKDIDLLAAGSLIPLKQFEVFIEVVAEIKKLIPGIKAVLIGDGPEKSKLKELIEKHELQSNIILTGELQYPIILQWMQRAKVFLHPSSYEGFSGVCQEALAAGAHVISFCKPMKQDINHWHIVTNKDEMKILALEMLQNPGIAFEKIIPFGMNETAKKMMKLFEM